MLKKRITKMISIALILAFTLSMNVFAAEADDQQDQGIMLLTQESTGHYSTEATTYYTDEWGVSHKVVANVSCHATVQWEEGYYGWIVTIHFNAATATIDGQAVGTAYKGSTSISNSLATQEYTINNAKTLTVRLSVDGYGVVRMTGAFD